MATTKQPKILIADDEATITTGLSAILSDEGYDVEVAGDGQRALDRLTAESFGVVLADLKMPKLDGLALLKELQKRTIPTECIIVTGQATVDSAVQAMRQGAYDYIEKPLNAEKLNRLKALIPKALDKFNVKATNRALASEVERLTHYGELTGQSEQMRHVYQVIDAVAPSNASVLILGESGTGKELVARAIHSLSLRRDQPFVAVNCGAMPEALLESELFGHVRGAFTGADKDKKGLIEAADGGTVFLDEIGEMPPSMQVKLLRVLQERKYRRVGGTDEASSNIRVIAATNRDLPKQVGDGKFREDLFYRLNVIPVRMPALRERVEDIPIIAEYFLSKYGREMNKTVDGFAPEAMTALCAYPWPGNVRELENVVERSVALQSNYRIEFSTLPQHLRDGRPATPRPGDPVGDTGAGFNLERHLQDIERSHLERALDRAGGVQTRAADVLGLSFRQFRYLMKKHAIKRD